jgi:hypothetical protein
LVGTGRQQIKLWRLQNAVKIETLSYGGISEEPAKSGGADPFIILKGCSGHAWREPPAHYREAVWRPQHAETILRILEGSA